MTTILTPEQRARFERDGVVRLPGAFTADEAAAMRDVVWTELETRGIRRDDPSTWTSESPDHLQHLKARPELAAVWSPTTLGAIADLLGQEPHVPADTGAFFLLFPTPRPWTVPWKAWHVDHAWLDPKGPLRAIKVHSHFGETVPRSGGMTILAGGHHVIDAIVRDLPPFPERTRGEVIRKAVMGAHPYLRELGTDVGGDPAKHQARIERFVDREEDVLGFPVRVVENTAQPGDVLLMHPLTLHTRPTNAGTQPRLVLNKDLYPPGGASPSRSA